MSVLWVIATMMRPASSKITRKCGSALSAPRSDVRPPERRQKPMLAIWGTSQM